MKLKTVKYVLYAGCALVAACLLLCSGLRSAFWGYLALALLAVTAGFWLLCGRCPHCGHYLGHVYGKYCPHCGEKIDW